MKPLFKRISKSIIFQKVICWLIANYIRLVYYTSRKTYDFDPDSLIYVKGHKPVIFSFWHGRLLMMPMECPSERKMNVMISTHSDGQIISSVMDNFGLNSIRGSSTRGGSSAALRAVKALQAGENVCVTPDGPRGPAMRIQPGIITIAEMAKMPIIASTYSSSRNKRANSWDRFMIPLPFGSIHYKTSAPLFNIDAETLEKHMVEITWQADIAVLSTE